MVHNISSVLCTDMHAKTQSRALALEMTPRVLPILLLFISMIHLFVAFSLITKSIASRNGTLEASLG